MKQLTLRLRGFTLVELSVSLAIMGVLMVIMLSRYPDSALRINLANYTHSLALLIREAQLRGSAVDSSSGAYGGYGVFVTQSDTRSIVFFGDSVEGAGSQGIAVGNGLYDTASVIAETKSTTTLPLSFRISKMCAATISGTSCNQTAAYGVPAISNLTISFTRPNSQAKIYVNQNSAVRYTSACIELSTNRAPQTGHRRSVQVSSSGMVTTSYSPCE